MPRFVTVWLHRTRMGAAVSQNKHSVNNTVISWNITLIIQLISAQTIASYLWFAVGSFTSVAGLSREGVGHVAAGLALQDSLGEEGDAAGPEISFGARSGRCAGFRDVVTRAWPVSSYFCEWIVRGLRGRPAGSFGAAGLWLDPNRRGFFPSPRLLQG